MVIFTSYNWPALLNSNTLKCDILLWITFDYLRPTKFYGILTHQFLTGWFHFTNSFLAHLIHQSDVLMLSKVKNSVK